MPWAAKRPCKHSGCPALVSKGYCNEHQHKAAQARQQADSQRGTSSQRGYGSRWQKVRATFLAHHPLCAHCKASGYITAAKVVDHIRPHRGDQALFWNHDNWQALCKPCHDRKTATEDGGFGNRNSTGGGGG